MNYIKKTFRKIDTAQEIFFANKSIEAKINFLKCITYNSLPNKLRRNKLNFFPISTTIYVNTICNYRCEFCFLINDDHKGSKTFNLDIEGFNKLIAHDFMKYSGRITLGGGEPLLNKNLYEFIKILRKQKKVISIYSNGSLLSRQYDSFMSNQPNYMNISHYDDKFEDLSASFKLFNNDKHRKCITRLSKIVQKSKIRETSKIVETALFNNFDRIIFQNYFSYKNLDTEEIIYEDDKEFNEEKVKIESKFGSKIEIIWPNLLKRKKSFGCNNISINSTIDSQGNISPCCFITPPEKKYGNLFEDGKEVWNGRPMMEFRSYYGKDVQIDECKNCYFNSGLNNRVV